jgi:biotin operon repressor
VAARRRLADEGASLPLIAQQLSLSRTEVELLLELRRLRAGVG